MSRWFAEYRKSQSQSLGDEMADLRIIDKDVIILAGALWTLLTREYSADLPGFGDSQVQEQRLIGGCVF